MQTSKFAYDDLIADKKLSTKVANRNNSQAVKRRSNGKCVTLKGEALINFLNGKK